ncbi:MAG: TetR/AcrR family transcriptional regulator [Ruminiclostridium sp.]|nr:TetR/AcrR family transcriptional regulator [Ruminiclostridium sp.]
MQIKKAEVKTRIEEFSRREFLVRGYENASLRIIAKKAHLSIGNIYHYFSSKEEILESLLLPSFERIKNVIHNHIVTETNPVLLKEFEQPEQLELFLERSHFYHFLDENLIIFLRLESTKFLEHKTMLLNTLEKHLKWHLHTNDAHAKIMLNMLIECVKYILIQYGNSEKAKIEFTKIFRILCFGIVRMENQE